MGIRAIVCAWAVFLLTSYALAASSSYYVAALVTARDLYQDRNLKPALQSARQALHLNPEGWEAYLLAAKITYDLKSFDESVTFAEKGLTFAPDDRKNEFRELSLKASNDKPRTSVMLKGTPFLESWMLFSIDGDRDSLYVKNPTVRTREIPIIAARTRFNIMKRFMNPPNDGNYNPLGRQDEFENVADRACAYGRDTSKSITPISTTELDREFPQSATLDSTPKLSAKHSLIRFPEEDRIEIAAAIFSCRDPVRRRFKLAQIRASLMHIRAWQAVVAQLLVDKKESARRRGVDPNSFRSTESRSNQVMIKTLSAQLAQTRTFEAWLSSNECLTVLTKEQVDQLKTETKELTAKIHADLDRIDRHPSSTTYLRSDILFIQYLYNSSRQ